MIGWEFHFLYCSRAVWKKEEEFSGLSKKFFHFLLALQWIGLICTKETPMDKKRANENFFPIAFARQAPFFPNASIRNIRSHVPVWAYAGGPFLQTPKCWILPPVPLQSISVFDILSQKREIYLL
jgi:hypothetical protein